MNASTIIKTKIGKIPAVIFPLKYWQEIEEKLDDSESNAYFLEKKLQNQELKKNCILSKQLKKY